LLVLRNLIAGRQVGIEEFLRSKTLSSSILALRPSPVLTACSTQNRLMTGSMPGKAASTGETCVFGSAPKSVAAPENSLAFEITWA